MIYVPQWSAAKNDSIELRHGNFRRLGVTKFDKPVGKVTASLFTSHNFNFLNFTIWCKSFFNVSFRTKNGEIADK